MIGCILKLVQVTQTVLIALNILGWSNITRKNENKLKSNTVNSHFLSHVAPRSIDHFFILSYAMAQLAINYYFYQ